MASTREADHLTRQYQHELTVIKAAVVRDVLRVWPLLNLSDVSTSWPALSTVLASVIDTRRTAAVIAAENYVRRFRNAEGIAGAFHAVHAEALARAAVDVSLRVTGPATMLRAVSRGMPVDEASKRALGTVSGAASRIALDGARQTVVLSVGGDKQALGWMRVTRGDSCAFCAMLASRGPVYKTSGTAGRDTNSRFVGEGQFKFHDHCDCALEPVYSRKTTWPTASVRAKQVWESTTAGLSGKDAINAFRRAYEAH